MTRDVTPPQHLQTSILSKALLSISKAPRLRDLREFRNHGAMLFAHHVDDEDDEEFVLVLPPGSVRSYFRREGRGMALVVEPGLLSSSGEFERVKGDVRTAVLTEAGRVLNVRPTDVLNQPFDSLKSIAERDGFAKTPWDSRKRTRGRSGGSSRKGATHASSIPKNASKSR